MKRIKAACLQQTVHFMLRDGVPHQQAVQDVQQEYAQYKAQLERRHTKYRVTQEETQPDGSILIRIRKQYNAIDCGDYLD